MKTVADFKEFILRWFCLNEWKEFSERDERQGDRRHLLHRFWHILHGMGNPGYRRIEEEITESDCATPITDGQWEVLWVLFDRLYHQEGKYRSYPWRSHEESLELLLREKREQEEDAKFLEEEWEGGEEIGTFWAYPSRRSLIYRFLGSNHVFELNGRDHEAIVILATEPQPPVRRWSEFIVRKARSLAWKSVNSHIPHRLGKWTGKTKEGKYLLGK